MLRFRAQCVNKEAYDSVRQERLKIRGIRVKQPVEPVSSFRRSGQVRIMRAIILWPSNTLNRRFVLTAKTLYINIIQDWHFKGREKGPRPLPHSARHLLAGDSGSERFRHELQRCIKECK